MSLLTDMEQSKEVKLAYDIARTLNDMHSIDLHIRFCKRFDAEFLMDKMRYILSRTDIENPAKYYTKTIKAYEKYSRR